MGVVRIAVMMGVFLVGVAAMVALSYLAWAYPQWGVGSLVAVGAFFFAFGVTNGGERWP